MNRKNLKAAGVRLLQLLPVLFAITFLSFAMMRLAGSDVVLQKMERTGMVVSREMAEAARAQLGLDRPFLVQYLAWLGDLLQGDMGVSYVSGREVLPELLSRLPATLLLTAVSLALTLLISIPLGILAAVRQNRLTDDLIRGVSFAGNSMPNFFTALLLLYFFAVRLQWFPVIAREASPRNVVLPALTLAIAMSSRYLRQVRALVLEELSRDYVAGARARGIPFGTVLFRNVLKSCLPPLITLLALSAGSLLGGTAVVESVFMWDGVGKLAVDAIEMRDYPMIQAYVMWMALIYVCVNFLADLAGRVLDPRTGIGGGL